MFPDWFCMNWGTTSICTAVHTGVKKSEKLTVWSAFLLRAMCDSLNKQIDINLNIADKKKLLSLSLVLLSSNDYLPFPQSTAFLFSFTILPTYLLTLKYIPMWNFYQNQQLNLRGAMHTNHGCSLNKRDSPDQKIQLTKLGMTLQNPKSKIQNL